MKQSMDEKLREAFGRSAPIPAETEARLALCYERVMSGEKGTEMKHLQHKPRRRTLRTALALAAAICVLAGAALAVADYTGLFESAFGDAIAAQEAHDVELVDADGNVVKTEHYPASDRAPVDTDQAAALIGDYVSAVGQSATIGDYTFTICECVLDENGIGAVTIDVENPNGVSRQTVFDGAAGELAPYNIVFRAAGNTERAFDDCGFIDEAASTDTCVRWVYYIIANDAIDSDITVSLGVWTGERGEKDEPLYETAALTIAQGSFVGAEKFTGGDFEAALSPVGLTLRLTAADGFADLQTKELVIRYADGSEYTVEGEDWFSYSAAFGRDNGEVCYALNRLVDVENVSGIYLRGYYYEPVTVDTVETTMVNADGMAEVVETPTDPTGIVEPQVIHFDLTLTP